MQKTYQNQNLIAKVTKLMNTFTYIEPKSMDNIEKAWPKGETLNQHLSNLY